MIVKMKENEYWWCGCISKGYEMPFDSNTDITINLEGNSSEEDQFAPIMLSSLGRYIWSENSFLLTVKNGEIDIDQTPANLDDGEAKELFAGMLTELADNGAAPEHQKEALFEKALYQVCCKGAIKGGDKNNEEAIKALLTELFAHPEITYCPHGRPVAFRMSKAAMERRFGRT